MLMEIVRDPSLLRAVREEIATATDTDPATGKPILDNQRLVGLPLLQSIWTETLRLRINFNIMRDVKHPVVLDSGATTVAAIVSRFDLEVVAWTKADGSTSPRAAESDLRYCGAGAMPPDRDLKIRWKRIH